MLRGEGAVGEAEGGRAEVTTSAERISSILASQQASYGTYVY
jgi:hypothetical protein